MSSQPSTADEEGRGLWISKISVATDAQQLQRAFAPFGTVSEANVVKPGLAHVTFEDLQCASKALESKQGVFVDGQKIGIRRARSYFIRVEQQEKLRLLQSQRQRESLQSNAMREQAESLDRSGGVRVDGVRGKKEEWDVEDDSEDDDGEEAFRLQRQRMTESRLKQAQASPFGIPEGAKGIRQAQGLPDSSSPFGQERPVVRRADRFHDEEDDEEEDEDEDAWAEYDRDWEDEGGGDWKDDGATAKDVEREGSKWQDVKKKKNDGWENDDEVSLRSSRA